MKNTIILLVSIIAISCTVAKPTPTQNGMETFWVNSYKTPCEGVAKTTCLNIQKKDSLDFDGKWETFYNHIEGFNYQPGKIYQISVKVDSVSNPPADGSSIKYTLNKIINTKDDPRFVLHDIWKVVKINDSIVPTNVVPTIEINTTTKEVAGNDGCNQFGGGIHKLNETEITFGALMQTRKMCQDMNIPNAFTSALSQVKFYSKTEHLILLNKDNTPILELSKID